MFKNPKHFFALGFKGNENFWFQDEATKILGLGGSYFCLLISISVLKTYFLTKSAIAVRLRFLLLLNETDAAL